MSANLRPSCLQRHVESVVMAWLPGQPTLRVRGRRSGRIRTILVRPVGIGDARYLVALVATRTGRATSGQPGPRCWSSTEWPASSGRSWSSARSALLPWRRTSRRARTTPRPDCSLVAYRIRRTTRTFGSTTLARVDRSRDFGQVGRIVAAAREAWNGAPDRCWARLQPTPSRSRVGMSGWRRPSIWPEGANSG